MQIRHLKFKELLMEELFKKKKTLCYNASVIISHLSDLAETSLQDKVTKCPMCYGMEYAVKN